jgi:orotate phosphoribosyltransferase
MAIQLIKYPSPNSNLSLRVAHGHFATSHSHINYFVDMTYTKHRLAEARQAARELAVKYRSSEYVDTILCLDGTEVLGACLAEELISEGIKTENEHNTLYVITPETTTGNMQIFRENIAHLIRRRRILILAASVTTGNAVLEAIEAVRYYGGIPVGICSIFSCLDTCGSFPVTTIFHSKVLGDYSSVPAGQCPLCKAGVKLDALVNSYGISSFYK